jgi:hypothetical protein
MSRLGGLGITKSIQEAETQNRLALFDVGALKSARRS